MTQVCYKSITASPSDFSDNLNDFLDEVRSKGGEVIDVQFSSSATRWMHYHSALVSYTLRKYTGQPGDPGLGA